ncbi:MAG: DUF916 domain-containing protein [Candidatus Gracilibacteria bacterium]
MKKLLTTIGTSIFLAALTALPAHAATGDFTIYPTYQHGDNTSWILLKAEQGQTTKDFVTIENLTNEPLSLNLEILDANDESGTFLLNQDPTKKNLSGWMSIGMDSIDLKPHEKKNIQVDFNIPDNAKTQEYKASILASKSEKNAQNILITTRIGVRVYANIVEPTMAQTNIFATPAYSQTAFFVLSLFGVLAAMFYNLIHYIESKKYAKKQA